MKLRALLGEAHRRYDAARPRPLMGRLRGELFVLLHPAGTDAAPFVAALNRHPALICHEDALGPRSPRGFGGLPDELLAKARASEKLAAFQATFPEAYLYKYVFDSRGCHAVGFKVETDVLMEPAAAWLRNALMQDPDVRVIYYSHRNLLWAHVAELGRRQGGEAVTVAPQAFLRQARHAEHMDHYMDRLFDGHRKLMLDADRFISHSRTSLLEQVAGYMNLGPFPAMKAEHSLEPPRPRIANAAELEAALAGTPYARMLEL